MSEAKTWTLFYNDDLGGHFTGSLDGILKSGTEVIEKSAFDAMKAERGEWKDKHEYPPFKKLTAERDALAQSLREAVMALEQYSHIPIANDPFNTSSAKSNSFSPAADALSKLKIKHPEILK